MISVEGLEITRRARSLHVTVNRGERNLFSGEMMRSLVSAIRDADGDGDVRFLRVRAQGQNFCLGRDQEGSTPDELRLISSSIVDVGEAVRGSRVVSICEVEGDAAGFGVGLIAACDIAVVAEGVQLWFPELEAGLAPTVVLSWLVGAAGRKRAFELVASGRRFTASEAEAFGIVTEVTPPRGVRQRADQWQEVLEARNPDAVRDVKRFLNATRSMDEASRAAAAVDSLVVGALRNSGLQTHGKAAK